jgi:hypothetical protein
MENSSSILSIILQARDEASEKIKGVAEQIEGASKKTADMSKAFQVAGGILLGVGAAGVGIMKTLTEAASEHQVAMASVDTTLKNVSESLQTQKVFIQGNATAVKSHKGEIDSQIKSLKEQKLQYETMAGKHKDEISNINQEIKVLQLQKMRVDDVVISKGHMVTVSVQNAGSFQMLKKTADDLSESYLRLGFADHDTELAFAQSIRVTKDVSDAKVMLATAADLARMKHISLTDASVALTKAYEGSTKILKSMGIEVDKNAKGMEILGAVHKATAGQAQAFSNTYAGAMEILNVNMEKLKATLGERLLPMFTGFIKSIGDMVSALNNLRPDVYNSIISILSFTTAFTLLSGSLIEGIVAVTSIIKHLAEFDSRIRIIVLVITLAAAIGWTLYQNWSRIAPLFAELGNRLGVLSTVWDNFSQLTQRFYTQQLQPVLQAFGQLLLPILQQIATEFQSQMLPVWNQFTQELTAFKPLLQFIGILLGTTIVVALGAVAFAVLFVADAIRLLMPVFSFVFGFITATILAFLGVMQAQAVAIMNFFSLIKDGGLPALQRAFVNTFSDIQMHIHGVVDSVIADVKSMVNNIIDTIDNLIKGANNLGSKLHAPNIPAIPHFAQGTSWFEGGMAMVGENGPELVNLPRGSQVVPNSQVHNYYKTPNITLGPVYVQNQADIDVIVQKLSHALKYDSGY